MRLALRHILVPTDFSDESRAPLAYGAALAGTFNASHHVLHVLQAVVTPDQEPVELEAPRVEARAWEELRALLSSDKEYAGLDATLAIEWGLPAVEIVRYAREKAIDLIAIGTHGRGSLKRLILGSVAESVVREAPCPVLTIHHWDREVSSRPVETARTKEPRSRFRSSGDG
jgi:universal stress protein A